MSSFLQAVVTLIMSVSLTLFGRWLYFHPKRFVDKLYGDLDLLKPTGEFGYGVVRNLGCLVLYGGAFLGVGLLCEFVFQPFQVLQSSWLQLIVQLFLSILATWYFLKRPSSSPV